MAAKRFVFTVEGRGEFPFDMLRYDQAWPHSEFNDSPQLRGGIEAPLRQVTLRCDGNPPTVGRWQSFGWKVIESGRWS